MKSVFKVSCLAAVILATLGCQDKEAEAKTATEAPAAQVQQVAATSSAAAATESAQFANEDDKISYALGVSMAKYLIENASRQEEIGINLNQDIIYQGVQDTFAGKLKMSDEEVQTTIMAFQERVNAAVQAEQQKKAEAFLAKAEATEATGKAFRDEFAKQKGVVTTKSGLMYKVIKQGDGAKPTAADKVKVNYEGKLVDGTIFDSSYQRNEPITFPLNGVIPGWTEGLQLMNVGSTYELVIPPQLAYGMQNSPQIPANSTLVFKVELLGVNPNAK
ncbi:FKBP-type peptidyl-prolyl cis-trans isomerase FkpA [Vibrio stylophorae]|uniref:Peptidyl-prolyl cis-trans isomerase n=1 Tax=Vibrio stylophorae TaxID=659351 RepID=A0ABN8DW39_9VIBR|nr:FKBP-type peptidyl-prolyl cis-trans isomerase [Vibrio stylophorae]CAH0534543.1 FKBP-type peptidyl-prolyl cis-trans isomerase FkpA [Vibrio stylophorae]